MAKKDVEITLKTIAKTGDAKQLLEYIDKLQDKLKSVSGTDNLQKQLNGIRDAIKPGTTSPEDVKKLLPDVSKINIQQYIATARNKLKEIGTAQAKVMQETLGKWDKTVAEGNLSEEALANMAPYMEKFVEQANKLPPKGLKAMTPILERMKESSQEALDTFTELNDIHFNFSGEAKTLGEVAHRIQMIGEARDVEGSLDELVQVLDSLPADKAKEAQEQVEKLKKALSGELSVKSSAEIKKLADGFLALQKNLDPKQFEKVAPALAKASSAAKTLSDSLKRTGGELDDAFKPIDAIEHEFNSSLGTMGKSVLALVAKIPLIGHALKKIPFVWLIAIVGACVKAFSDLRKAAEERWRNDQEESLKNQRNIIESIRETEERRNDIADLKIKKEKTALEIYQAQLEAVNKIKEADLEMEKNRRLLGAQTQEERDKIGEEFSKKREDLRYDKSKKDIDLEEQGIDNQLRALNERLGKIRSGAKGTGQTIGTDRKKWEDAAKSNQQLQADEEAALQYLIDNHREQDEWFAIFSSDTLKQHIETHQKKIAEYQRNVEEAQKKIAEYSTEEQKVRQEIAKLEGERANLAAKRKAADEEHNSELARQKKEAKENQRRIERERSSRLREENLRDRRRTEEDKEDARQKSEIGASDDTRLANEKDYFNEWKAKEDSLKKQLDAAEAEAQKYRADNETEAITPELQDKINNIRADYEDARGKRRGSQKNIDNLEHSLQITERDRKRQIELFNYNEEDQTRQNKRNIAEPYENLYEKLKTAEDELKRFSDEEQEAARIREKILSDLEKSGRNDMNEQEKFAFDNAVNDLTRARSRRYQEQSNIASLMKEIKDRDFEEKEYIQQIEREDAESVKARLDMYRSDGEKLAVERERYSKAVRDYEAANRKIQDDNSGVSILSPEERKVAERERNNARSYMTQSRSAIDQIEKSLYDRQFQESESRHSIEKEDADWQRGRLYNRANYAQRLRMDKAMYDKAKAEYEEANAAILADNAGEKTLSPEERQVMERRRNEARGYLTQSRDAISNAMYEGDTQRANFYSSVMKQGNRLTQMGLGGDVANWDKQTAANTRRIYEKNSEMVSLMKNRPSSLGYPAMSWGM